MLSRIEFLFKDHLNIDRNSKPRVKLNNKKLKYIINQKKKGRASAERIGIDPCNLIRTIPAEGDGYEI